MSDPKPTTKRRPSLKIHHPLVRPASGERCPACAVLYRFCEECHAWGCKCGDPVSVCQSCHQATCGNCGTPYGFVDAYRAESEPAAPPPLREIAEVLAYADPSGTSSYGPLKVVEQWLSGFALGDEPAEPAEAEDVPNGERHRWIIPGYAASDVVRGVDMLAEAAMKNAVGLEKIAAALDEPEPEPGEEVVGPVERVVLERLHPGGLGVALDAIVDVARAVDELAKRNAAEWAALRSAIDEAATESRQQIQRSVRLAFGGGAR